VTLAAGKGTIAEAFAFDENGNTITQAYAGQGVGLQINIKNTGGTDNIWCSVYDKDTGQLITRTDGISLTWHGILNAGATQPWTATAWSNGQPTLVMPNKTWNLLIQVGHGT
jgi:hypothetical protein